MADYEVFISFKNNDDNNNITRDAKMAESLYTALKEIGIKVFFSKYSIDEAARADYVDAIDEALDSSLLLVAVGTSKKNLSSRWVKSEINQFRTLMNSEEAGKRSIVSFRSKDYPDDELPSGLKPFQSFDDQNALMTFIIALFKKNSSFEQNHIGNMLLFNVSGKIDSQPISTEGKYLQIGDLLDSRYRILYQIGRGGMSLVYLAMDERTKRQFAIKEIRKDSYVGFEHVRMSMVKEAELLLRLDNPFIPKVHDIIETGDVFITVMDYIEGSALDKILFDLGSLHEQSVIDIACQLCEALDYLHNLPTPIIYRDLKPANIIMTPSGKIKLIDFGTAREYKNFSTADTVCLGTMGYAAPEQFGGKGQTDCRTDIYNLGVTLYCLVTGKNPAEPPYEILPIRQINPKLSRGLEYIIQKCTQKDPKQRFQSAEELKTALANIPKMNKRSIFKTIVDTASFRNTSKKEEQQTTKVAKIILPSINSPKAEFLMETTVLSTLTQEEKALSSPQVPESICNDASGSMTVPPKMASNSYDESGFYIGETVILTSNEKPDVFDFGLKADTTTATESRTLDDVPQEMKDVFWKMISLDPESQKIVRDLIERLVN